MASPVQPRAGREGQQAVVSTPHRQLLFGARPGQPTAAQSIPVAQATPHVMLLSEGLATAGNPRETPTSQPQQPEVVGPSVASAGKNHTLQLKLWCAAMN
jgi:hypothetical protein